MSTISLFHRKSGHIQNKKKSRRVWLIFSWCTKFEQRTSIQPVAGLPSCDMWFWFLPKRGLEKNDVASERCATAVFPCGSTNPRRVYKEVVDSSERISDAVPISSIDKVESSRGGGSINSLWGWSSHLNDRNPFHRYMYISYIYIFLILTIWVDEHPPTQGTNMNKWEFRPQHTWLEDWSVFFFGTNPAPGYWNGFLGKHGG